MKKQIQNNEPHTKQYLSSNEVCEILNISSRTLQRYRTNGKISYSKISERNFLYKLEDVMELINKNIFYAF
jgi:excisionase family DNA binding protein